MNHYITISDGSAWRVSAAAVDLINHITTIYSTPGVNPGREYRTAIRTTLDVMTASGIMDNHDSLIVRRHLNHLSNLQRAKMYSIDSMPDMASVACSDRRCVDCGQCYSLQPLQPLQRSEAVC